MLLLPLFALLGSIISGLLGLLVCAAIVYFVVRMKNSDADAIGSSVGDKAKSLADGVAGKAKTGAESLADGASALAGTVAEAIKPDTLDVGDLGSDDIHSDPTEDIAEAFESLPTAPDAPDIELNEPADFPDVEASIDDVLAGDQTFEIKDPGPAATPAFEAKIPESTTPDSTTPDSTTPGSTLGASVPPPRPRNPTQSSFASNIPSPGSSSSIPPRRDKRPVQGTPIPQPQAFVPEPDEIEVLDDSPHISSFSAGSSASSAADQQELSELRLSLEASHNELTHLTTQRDQALSRAVQHEEELSQLRQQVENLNAASESLQRDRQTITQLEAELESLRSQVKEAPGEDAIRAVEAQHQSTVEELRLVLGQREAAEASLSRERDNLTAQNEDLRRKVEQLESGEAPEPDNSELLALQQQHQQTAAELSLTNETVRQLNQNLNQRDSQLMNLRNEVQSLTTQLAESESAAEESANEPDPEVIEQIEAQHKATVDELRSIIEEREAAEAKLASEREKLSVQVSDLREQTVRLEEELTATKQAASEAASQESPEHSLANETIRQLNQNLTQRDAELFNLRREFQAFQSAAENDEGDAAEAEDNSEEVSRLETQVQELKEELETLKQSAAQAASQESPEHSLANETVRQLNQNLTQRDAELFHLRRELQTLQAAAENDEDDADDAEDNSEEVSQLEAKVEELEADRKRLRDEFASARERLHEELASAKEAEQAAKEEIETVQTQVTEQVALVEQLREERRNRQDEIVALKAKVAESEDTTVVEKLTAERDDALVRYDKLQIDFAHALQDQSSPAEEATEELKTLQAKLSEKSSDFDALQAEHHTLKARFTAETEALKGRIESLQAQATDEPESEADTEEVADDREDASAKIAELEAVIERHEQYAAGLQTERQDLLDQLGASQEDINVKAAEMRRMREQLQAAQSQASSAAQQQDEFSESQTAREELSQTLEERQTALKRLQEEQIELKQQLAHFIDAEELWTTQRVSLYSRLGLDENGEPLDDDALNANGNGESEQIEALKQLLVEREEAIEKLNERFESLSKMYSASDETSVLHDDASDPQDALRAERDQAAASAAEASATIAKLMGEIGELKSNEVDASRLTSLEEENREYRRSVAELHASVNELDELKLSREREQESSRQKLMEAGRANAELSAKLEELQQELASESASTTASESGNDEPASAANDEELNTLKKLSIDLKRQRDQQAKTIEELKSEIDATPKDRKESVKAVRDVKRLTSKVESQDKKLRDRDDRLQDLAAELSKLRVEASSLRNEVAEQKAVVRALNKGEDVTPAARPAKSQTSKAEKNGKPRPAKKAAAKKTAAKRPASARAAKPAKKKAATRKADSKKPAAKKPVAKKPVAKKPAKKKATASSAPKKKDANLGMVFTKRPKAIDDLKKISGIGPVLEKRLNAAGIYQFSQVKDWSKKTIDYLDEELTLGGRIRRDKWINQAKRLAK